MLRLYLTILLSELRFELSNFFISAMRSPEKIWYPPLTFIHFEIFALLRPPPVRNGMDCDKSYKFSFELRCGLMGLEVWRICAVAYESFETQKQTI